MTKPSPLSLLNLYPIYDISETFVHDNMADDQEDGQLGEKMIALKDAFKPFFSHSLVTIYGIFSAHLSLDSRS